MASSEDDTSVQEIECMHRALDKQPSKPMPQASLAAHSTVKWALNFAATLGKFQSFLQSCPHMFGLTAIWCISRTQECRPLFHLFRHAQCL